MMRPITETAMRLPMTGTVWKHKVNTNFRTVFGVANCLKTGDLLVLFMNNGQPETLAQELSEFLNKNEMVK